MKEHRITIFSKKINGFVENIFKHAMWEFSKQIKLLPKFFTKCWLRLSLADKSLCILLYTGINLESVSFTHFALTITIPVLNECNRESFSEHRLLEPFVTCLFVFYLNKAMTSSYWCFYEFRFFYSERFPSVVLVWFPWCLGRYFDKYAKNPALENKHLSLFKWLIPLTCCCHVHSHTQQPLQWAGAA